MPAATPSLHQLVTLAMTHIRHDGGPGGIAPGGVEGQRPGRAPCRDTGRGRGAAPLAAKAKLALLKQYKTPFLRFSSNSILFQRIDYILLPFPSVWYHPLLILNILDLSTFFFC